MIKKIKAALQQGPYKNLGLTEKAYEGAAAYIATSIKDEAEIETIVNSDAVKALLTSFQSVADEARAKKNEQTPPPSDTVTDPGSQPANQPDLAAAIAAAVAAEMSKVVTPLQEKLNAFETAKSKEASVAALDKFINEWDYAGGFPAERDAAKRIAMKVYKAGGEQMTGEQLIAAFREEFEPAVKGKGVTDFSKPFKNDGGSGDAELDMSGWKKTMSDMGWDVPKQN